VRSEARDGPKGVREIEVAGFEETLPVFRGADFLKVAAHRLCGQNRVVEGDQPAMAADLGGLAFGEVQVRAVPGSHVSEQPIDPRHRSSLERDSVNAWGPLQVL